MNKIIDIPKMKKHLLELNKSDNIKLSKEQKELKSNYKRVLMLPDQFNSYFSKNCWIAFDSFDDSIMKKAINIYEKEKNIENVDIFLSNLYDENFINIFINQIMPFKNLYLENLPNIGTLFYKYFLDRIEMIEIAKCDYINERYYSCITILLLAIDGITNDIDHEFGFFNKYENMILENSIVGHPTGLQTIKNIVTLPRKTTNLETLTIPYRNGILHGRDINFGNKIVAAKCWNILFALKNWAIDNNIKNFTIENKHPITKDDIDKFSKNNFDDFLIDLFNKLKDGNKSHELIYYNEYPTNIYSKFHRMKELGRLFKDIKFLNFKIIEQNDLKKNIKLIHLEIDFIKDNKQIKQNIESIFKYSDINNKLVSIHNKNGYWKVDFSLEFGKLTN